MPSSGEFALLLTSQSADFQIFPLRSGRILRHDVAWYGPSPTQNDANRRLRRFASFSKRYQQLKGNPELQATELPSMHLALSRETPEVFGVTQHTNIPQDAAQSKTIRFHKDTNNLHRRNMP